MSSETTIIKTFNCIISPTLELIQFFILEIFVNLYKWSYAIKDISCSFWRHATKLTKNSEIKSTTGLQHLSKTRAHLKYVMQIESILKWNSENCAAHCSAGSFYICHKLIAVYWKLISSKLPEEIPQNDVELRWMIKFQCVRSVILLFPGHTFFPYFMATIFYAAPAEKFSRKNALY